MTQIYRYPREEGVVTPLDPLDDVVSWISGLNSMGYTSDILREVHGFNNSRVISKCSNLIATYANNSIGFITQAFSGPKEVSFLPLYYSILNLSKIYAVISGKQDDLVNQRYHGAIYDPHGKASQDLLNEFITLKQHGVLRLIYESITSEPWKYANRKIYLRDIYPYLQGSSYEFTHAYKEPNGLQLVRLELEGSPEQGYVVQAQIGDSAHKNAGNLRYLRLFTEFRRPNPSESNTLSSKRVYANSEAEALTMFSRNVRRFLIYHRCGRSRDLMSMTPINANQMYLPQEIPIWIAFFHLSSIVRYNPEFLEKLVDSKSWPLLLSLIRHSSFRFLILFWSFFHQASYYVIIG